MINIDTIFDNINEYSDRIDDLVKALKQVGIKNFDEFKEAAREAGVSVKRSIRDQVAEKFANSEEEDWEEAKEINTEAAYQNYLDSYPKGAYRNSARDQIEELQRKAKSSICDEMWDSVNKGNITDLQNFVDKFPDSQYYSEAVRLLKELRRERYLGVDIRALAKQIKAIKKAKQNVVLKQYLKLITIPQSIWHKISLKKQNLLYIIKIYYKKTFFD